MRASVSKTFRFEAAHHLPNHDGKCKEPHGHSYKVVVHCTGNINLVRGHEKEGMVVDFADIKSCWEAQLEPLLDHKDLNVTLKDKVPQTTAECLAAFICDTLSHDIPVSIVEVWETETSCARVSATDVWSSGGFNR